MFEKDYSEANNNNMLIGELSFERRGKTEKRKLRLKKKIERKKPLKKVAEKEEEEKPFNNRVLLLPAIAGFC